MTKLHAAGRALLVLLAVTGLLALAPRAGVANAVVAIINNDGPGEGFNDATPAAPVGGNAGATVGQQRLIAFQFAADLWGATLDSKVPINVVANFDPLSCNATSAVLGSAGALWIEVNFPGATAPDTWHPVALANKLSGVDLETGPDPVAAADIRARFNSNLGATGCLTGIGWYYGLDGNHGTNIDLVTVLLHELGHGMGFQQFASITTGALFLGLPDVYNKELLDLTTNKTWDQMTNAERVASAINSRKLVWTGPEVTTEIPGVLSLGTPLLNVTSPASVAGTYQVGAAAFGPQLSSPGVSGTVVRALDPADGAGPTTFDGCSAFTNAGDILNNIALIDRGSCTFVTKVKNAQNAGAIAVIVADNAAGAPPAGLGGTDPTITIPSVRITQADGNAIKAALAGGPVTATLGVDLALRAGADPGGRALMNTPNPVQPGSSVSHWDPIAFPNQLMEPAINADLTHSVTSPQDLTLALMRDIGWYPDADLDMVPDGVDCEAHSDFSATIVIDGCDTHVPNTFQSNGCTLADLFHHLAADAQNHGDFVSLATHLANALKASKAIPASGVQAIVNCAAHSSIGQSQVAGSTPASPAPIDAAVPESFGVQLAGSNPARGGALLEMRLPARTNVEMAIYDVRGAMVWQLGRELEAGRHWMNWDGRDLAGRLAPAGMYFVRVVTPERSAQLRFTMLR